MADSGEGGSLATETLRREFRIRDYLLCFFGGVDLRDHQTAAKWIERSESQRKPAILDSPTTHCAPVSKARFNRSGAVPLTRMIGLTPKAEMAATELCIDSSPIFPCSQSTMIPW